ncbi:Gfo/Idh/MocA family oxidoreductase [candidate division KSB1 bacterium]|nr:Gfo/Idh/MocA family oxidoreductase [candidate division KSB1 bacterium]
MDEKDKKESSESPSNKKIDRRDFLQGLAGVPVLGALAVAAWKQEAYRRAIRSQRAAGSAAPEKEDDLHVALLGVGAQGDVLLNSMLKIPGLRFQAVCDIWSNYNLKRAGNLLRKYGHEVNTYEDYRAMLDREKGLDAVVIATPDFWHAEHTIACLQAGLNVYCEKEMSNTLEDARRMALAAGESGKLLQIGHQRRSNPRYIFSHDVLLKELKLLGRMVTAYGQWNRSAAPDLGWPKRYEIPLATLRKYGYESMHQFCNWRWYKNLGGGPIVDLGSHQIDIFSWFLGVNPKSVMASGGTDYYDKSTHEWYDTVMAIYEYETAEGTVRAHYKTQTTNGSLGYFEQFMGDEGTLVISESANVGSVYREKTKAPMWDRWVRKGYLSEPKLMEMTSEVDMGDALDVRETISPDEHKLTLQFYDAYHKPHLENFFNAVRGREKLNCPAELGYESAVAVLKVNKAVEAKRTLFFDPQEFLV